MPLLGEMLVESGWRPRSRCSSTGCAAMPFRHFRLDSGEREVFLSFCESCAEEVPKHIPAWCVLTQLGDGELEVAEVMAG